MAKSNADRQREFRERRAAGRAREAVRELAGEICACCGETHPSFLERLPTGVYCRNCAYMNRNGWLCPHQGISRRLG